MLQQKAMKQTNKNAIAAHSARSFLKRRLAAKKKRLIMRALNCKGKLPKAMAIQAAANIPNRQL